ncbi:MAG: flagellar biosynthetic protein FliO [Planctomycetaceae bacterium]|nr:flagellar biosynthetic protein FliO [Planctomycetaceae bacterium]
MKYRCWLSSIVLLVIAIYIALGAGDVSAGEQKTVEQATIETTEDGWRTPEAVREDFAEDLGSGFSFWWLALFFALSMALLVWLAWRGRNGLAFGRAGQETIDIVARKMFGSRHGVVCVRLRDREFLLGLAGDNVSLISEWRTRTGEKKDAGRKTNANVVEQGGGDSGAPLV